jgi:hypothetical protein
MMTTAHQADRAAVARDTAEAALGYTPFESLVIVADAPCGAIVRADLDDLTGDSTDLLSSVAGTLAANGVTRVSVLYYTGRSPAFVAPTDRHLTQALMAARITRAGTTLIDDTPPVRHLVDRKSTPRPADRREAQNSFNAATPDLADYLRALDTVREGQPPTPQDVGRAAKALTSLLLRDAVVVHLTGTTLPKSECFTQAHLDDALVARAMATMLDPDFGSKPPALADAHATLLSCVVELLPDDKCAPAHTILAMRAWWAGDTVDAEAHLTRALAADPTYRLAHLMGLAFSRAIRPGWQSRA